MIIMNKYSARSIRTCSTASVRRDYERSTSQQSAEPTNDGRTRSNKRKASPEKNTLQNKRRVSEVPKASDTGSIRNGKRKGTEYEQLPSKKINKRRKPILNNYNKEAASTSVVTERSTSQQSAEPTIDGRTRSNKRKASPEKNTLQNKRRVSEVPKASDTGSIRNGKRKGTEYEQLPSRKTNKRRKPILNNYNKESASSSVDTELRTSQQSAEPTNDGRTRSNKRKASPEKNTLQNKRRVSEVSKTWDTGSIRNGKRKGTEYEHGLSEKTNKRRKLFLNNYNKESVSSSVDTELSSNPLQDCSRSMNGVNRRCSKRKASTDGEGPSSKKERGPDQKEVLPVDPQRVEFEAKYTQQDQLGQGGCGCVFAGYRNADNLPVAIKHIPKDKVYCKAVDRKGRELSVEVAVMIKLAGGKAGSVGTSVPVSLLDWYDLGQELILVLERPVPCADLLKYIEVKGGSLQEEQAKIIIKQLVDAAKELQNKRIFHRDIKVENILIETGWDVPRVRLIDFGLSCFFKKTSSYRVFYGTLAHVPPEWHLEGTYRAGPTTVWQLGVVLFEMLHTEAQFETTEFLQNKLEISNELSTSCKDFLQMCLTKVPEQRPTLEQLQLHPWLK